MSIEDSAKYLFFRNKCTFVESAIALHILFHFCWSPLINVNCNRYTKMRMRMTFFFFFLAALSAETAPRL